MKLVSYLIMLIFLLTVWSLPRILSARERAGRDTSWENEKKAKLKF